MRKYLKIFSITILALYFGSLLIPINDNLNQSSISLIFGIFFIPLALYESIILYKDDKKNNTTFLRNRLILMAIATIILILNMIYWNVVTTP
jgi:4-hydroxybenzoate polyprenyltransferase